MSDRYEAQEGGAVLIAYRVVKHLRAGPVTSRTLMRQMNLSENTAQRHLNAAYLVGLADRKAVTGGAFGGRVYEYRIV